MGKCDILWVNCMLSEILWHYSNNFSYAYCSGPWSWMHFTPILCQTLGNIVDQVTIYISQIFCLLNGKFYPNDYSGIICAFCGDTYLASKFYFYSGPEVIPTFYNQVLPYSHSHFNSSYHILISISYSHSHFDSSYSHSHFDSHSYFDSSCILICILIPISILI